MGLRYAQDRLNRARASCEQAATGWAVLLGATGLLLMFVPPLAPLGVWYTVGALVADGAGLFWC